GSFLSRSRSRMRSTARDVVVQDRDDLAAITLRRESLPDRLAGSHPELAGECLVAKDSLERRGEGRRVIWRYEYTVVAVRNQLGKPSDGRPDHRPAHGHCLGCCIAE